MMGILFLFTCFLKKMSDPTVTSVQANPRRYRQFPVSVPDPQGLILVRIKEDPRKAHREPA